jgi:hypothetical protein
MTANPKGERTGKSWPTARGWWGRLRRWGCAVAERVPLTFLGLLALPLLVWLLLPYALRREDRVLLAVSVCGLGLFAVALASVLLTALCLWLRRGRPEPQPLELEAGVPMRTGFVLRLVGWLPLVKVEWTWEQPSGVRVQTVPTWGGLAEEITAEERGVYQAAVRRLRVSDVFGLTKFVFRRRVARQIKILPAAGPIRPFELLPQYDRGDLVAHPEGMPEGDPVEMRPYAPGDPVRRILWKVYARTGRLVVRAQERAVKPCERSLAYLVAAAGDEPSAGIARGVLESGVLGKDYLFAAEGEESPTTDAREAVEQVVRSARAKERGGEGLGHFLAHGEAQGISACVLFVPHRPGPWLDRVAEDIAAHPGPFRVLVGVDGLRPKQKASALRKLVFCGSHRAGASPDEVGAVCERLRQAGADVSLIDRTTGELIEPGLAPAAAPVTQTYQAQGA